MTAVWLVRLHRAIDVIHEGEGTDEPYESKHHKECVRYDACVPKVKRQLQNTVHVRSVEEVKERIREDEKPRSTPVYEGAPPPHVILSRQLEVAEGYGDKGGHDNKHDKGQEKDPKQRVDLVAPDRGEDVVQLDVYRREGQETGHEQLSEGMSVPVLNIGHLRGLKQVAR
jgi:hypothetical protein